MTKKFFFSVFFSLLFCAAASAQMSDDEIVSYIRQGVAAGRTRNQIGNSLLSKGVTVTQAKRLMSKYGVSPASLSSDSSLTPDEDEEFLLPGTRRKRGPKTVKNYYGRDTLRRSPLREEEDELRIEKVRSLRGSEETAGWDDEFGDKRSKFAGEEHYAEEDRLYDDFSVEMPRKRIYGHDIFRNRKLTFEPNENAATPKGYVLGAGDDLEITVWGANEANLSYVVTPEGRIVIPQVGPVSVAGLTLEQAETKIRRALSSKYSLSGPSPQSHMSVAIGNIRTINVSVLGEVRTPGTYRLSSFSTVFTALYRAGGVTPIGSLRTVKVVRAGAVVGTADVYKFLFDGSPACDISLQDGDAVIVPAYSALVEVKGGFKRPMYYEAVPGESVGNIVKYAGGFASGGFEEEIGVERLTATDGSVHTVKRSDWAGFAVEDGDVITAYENNTKDVYENRIEIKGSVLRPGVYALGGDIATVRQLVEHAGGLLDDAFVARAQIIREKADRSLEVVAVPIGAVVDGSVQDIALKKNDILIVSDNGEIEKKGELRITGYVVNPGSYEFAEGMTVEDLILLAGGLEKGASAARVDVSRRIVDPNSTEAADTLAKVYSFAINDGLVADEDKAFLLEQFDVVAVRKSPTFVKQKRIRLSGEVTFPGEYTLISNTERLSDLFLRAGGATTNGYIGGAMLKRKLSDDERNVRRNLATVVKRGSITKSRKDKADTTDLAKLKMANVYTVGIDLVKALENRGGYNDIVLHDGDELIIPSKTNTVRVQGEVLYPNAVNFIPGKNVRYYVNQAGGFSADAKRAKVFVVHMNGKVTVGPGASIEPGCEIVVPARPERARMTVGEWLGVGTTAASITTMVATIANLMNK